MSRADLLVIGGGFAGLAAAARACELGAAVTVLEKGERIGGSAALAAGILFAPPDLETYRRVCPHGDAELGRVLAEGFDGAIAAVERDGIEVSERWTEHHGFAVAHWIDVPALLEVLCERIEGAGGRILRGAPARELLVGDGEVVGARAEMPGDDEEIEAGAVLIATGGFQGDPELVRRLIGPGAEEMLLRSNPHSTGDGLRMGLAAGAALSSGLDGFYGHLVPSPLDRFELEDHVPLAQYHSRAGLLVSRFGRRFIDEARGDHHANEATLRQRDARAVLLCDERVRVEYATGVQHPHGPSVDRLALARELGARVASTGSIEELVGAVASWGVNGPRLQTSIDRANADADAGGPRLVEPPFHAVEVQPAITFTFGGLRADAGGRALDATGRPVPGLHVAGADLGGLQEDAFVGGLSLGLVFGPRVAETALGA